MLMPYHKAPTTVLPSDRRASLVPAAMHCFMRAWRGSPGIGCPDEGEAATGDSRGRGRCEPVRVDTLNLGGSARDCILAVPSREDVVLEGDEDGEDVALVVVEPGASSTQLPRHRGKRSPENRRCARGEKSSLQRTPTAPSAIDAIRSPSRQHRIPRAGRPSFACEHGRLSRRRCSPVACEPWLRPAPRRDR